MASFNTTLEQLKARHPLPPLFPSAPYDLPLSHAIAALPSNEANDACKCGLLLWNDDLDASHRISQSMETTTGSFWHAIMHRREGDASNSRYWWRRTGAHPAFVRVYEAVLPILDGETSSTARAFTDTLRQAGTWLPMEFVTECERGGQAQDWLKRVQVAEIEALLMWCRDNSN